MWKRIVVAAVAAAMLMAAPASANSPASAAGAAAVKRFERDTPSRMQHERTKCRRRTTQKWWRCRTHVDGTKGYAGVFDSRVHRRTLRVRIVGQTITV